MSEVVKICEKHGELSIEQTYIQYSKYKDKKYLYYSCKECISLKKKRLYKLNPRKHIAMALRTREKYREKSLLRENQWKIKRIMPLEKYEQMIKEQNNLCAICNQPENSTSSKNSINKKRLSIDHCHKTGKIRGLLCHHCNTALGGFKDSIEILQSAIEYLKASR